jgi:hypothetical protein
MVTENTSDLCAAVVKGQASFNKNPAQHLSDLTMLQNVESFKDAFNKDVECVRCVRVDMKKSNFTGLRDI